MSNSNSNSNKSDKLIDAVKELKSSQDSMERMFESKLDKLKSDLMTNVSEKVRALRDELSIDMVVKLNSMHCRVNNLEQQINQAENNGSVSNTQLSSSQNRNPLENQDVTIIAKCQNQITCC
ncbi:hypothetical protein KUTeg_009279 [Tegillarca granosa]|uniref:Uncharacterized protein n=1 Tax=Tegillarca granosa TaxID=220873 RepID=A0ABQ9F701_TEGGR|nr:hypothetical protein KUTeg_009279 [Tegillarca granosa]